MAFNFAGALGAPAENAPTSAADATSFTAPAPVLDLGSGLSVRQVTDPSDPGGVWFTVAVKNDSAEPVSRVLSAAEEPRAELALVPKLRHAVLAEIGASDPAVSIETVAALGPGVIRVTLPSKSAATLALHFEGVTGRPPVLAWQEGALIDHNRQAAVLDGLIAGLLAAAAAFALGAALFSGQAYARWAGQFLAALLFAGLVSTGIFDTLVPFAAPYGLSALALAAALAAALRLVNSIAPFEDYKWRAGIWVNRIAIGIVLLGAAALVNVPMTGLLVRVLALTASIGAAVYLAYCGRSGNAAARRLAPAATIFALVAAASAMNTFGLFGANFAASAAISGFSTAGALLVALAIAVPAEAGLSAIATSPKPAPAALQSNGLAARASEPREIAAVSASRQGVFDLNLHTGLVTLSAEAAELFGLPSGAVEFSPETWLGRIHPDDRSVYMEALDTYRRDPGTAFRLEFRARGLAGRTAWFELRATMTGQSTEAERCLGLIANVTARKNAEAAAHTPGPTDALTGLGTRAALLSHLEALRGDLKRAALAVFDVDRFKSVNSSLGREGGDALLVSLTGRLEEAIAESDGFGRATLFRLGGDMFAVLAQDVLDLKTFGGNLVETLSAPFHIDDRDIYLPVSVGVGAGAIAEDAEELVANAELAMVEIKREGGGKVCVYSSALAPAESRDPVELETDLRRAIEKEEFELHYQPIVRLKDGVVAGFEALVRWNHPERGLIEPQAFVPHAERTGLILPLGRFTLQRAAEDLARWQRFFPSKPPLFVSVNVAWRQLSDPAFIKDVASVMKKAAITKGSLRLELTEGAIMAGADRALTALKKLKSLGAGLAIDDFGTGYSSLSHLARFPFDVIKIDKSFLSGAVEPAGAAILRSIVMLAHDLKLAVVAEGVETSGEAARLKEMGCEFGQGFLLGMPVTASEINSVIVSAQAR